LNSIDSSAANGSLHGIRVLELARILAGPWAAQALADLGAEVIKVERPGEGDDTRGWGPPFMEAADGSRLTSSYYLACNRGKRSVAIDFETPDGQRIIRKLAARSDVLIENFKFGGLKKYGLDYESLSKENPRLIYCSITGFGQDGPFSHRAGYDLLVQGMGGIMDITGDSDGEPTRLGVAFADVFTGVYSALAITAALQERERTGRGSHIDMALMDTMVGVLANQATYYLVSGTAPKRMGNAHASVVPYQTFPTTDGWMLIACGNDGQFAKMMAVLGDPNMASDDRYRTNTARVMNRETLIPRLFELTRKFSRDDLSAKLEAAGVPAGPINTVADVFSNPQVNARGMRVDLPHPDAKGGSIPGVRTPITINRRRAAADRAPPRLGEHTEEVLREIGESLP
jgi:crotonobetainyl-CoA:carnitine CoA-transferase CaiB-like acyl-CoA transferase